MICDNCGCKIKGNPEKCPLCDKVFREPEKKKRKKGVGLYKNPFTLIYFVATVAIIVVICSIGSLLNWTKPAFIGCILALFPIYYIIRHTLFGMRNQASKLTTLAVVIAIFFIALLEITQYTKGYYFIFTTFLSALFLITATVIFSRFKVYYPYISCFLVYAGISWIPFAFCIARNTQFVFPLVSAIVQTTLALVVVAIFPKEIANQIKRFFAV